MLHEDVGASFVGCEDQRYLTPFQRQIIEATKSHEAEKQKERREEMQNNATGGGSRRRNPRANNNGLSRTVKKKYVNENDDQEIKVRKPNDG